MLLQGNTHSARKFRVQPYHLDGVLDFVGNARPVGVPPCPKLKIANGIVESVPVSVVDVLVGPEFSPKVLLHNEAVLKGSAASSKHQPPVAAGVDKPILIDGSPFAALKSTLLAAKLLLHVVTGVFAVLRAAKVTISNLSAKCALESRYGLLVHEASLSSFGVAVKENF